MNHLKKKLKNMKEKRELSAIIGYEVIMNVSIVEAAATPNTEEAKNLVKPWLSAGITIVQWAAVGLGIIYIGRIGLSYLQATEEERARMNVWGNIKRGILIVVIIESLVEIFKIFGLSQSY